MIRSKVFRQAGVTLTELLVVLVIVSILATIAVPVYINKAENARVSVAQVECRQLADAEESCAVIHGFYVPLQLLDDIAQNASLNTYADSIDREIGAYAIDQAKSYVNLDINQVEISETATDARVARMVKTWQGPFLTPQRVYTGPDDTTVVDPANTYNRLDYPLDPWGNPYRLYAPGDYGVIGTNGLSYDQADFVNIDFSDGKVTTVDPRRYDRYAVVSYGPDGISATDTTGGTGLASDDDIVYFFGKPNPENNPAATGTPTPDVTPDPTPDPTPDTTPDPTPTP